MGFLAGASSALTLVRQRVDQSARGDEDQNDATSRRADPLLKLVCGRLPDTDLDLASQPTLSRLENAVTARAGARMLDALGPLDIRERGRVSAPMRVLLDLDSTDDPTPGNQEGAASHGSDRQHMGHPLLVSMATLAT